MWDFTADDIAYFEDVLGEPPIEPLTDQERYVSWLEFEVLATREALKIVSRAAYLNRV